jgi:M6 family metalloprotease-like protein
MHIVQIEYSTEQSSSPVYLRNASLFITTDSQNNNSHRVGVRAERLRTPITKSDTSWSAITQPDLTFNVPEHGETALIFSSVIKMAKGDSILLRAVIDKGDSVGVPAENTLVKRSYHYGARSLTFTTGDLSPGTHKMRFEWKAGSAGASATISAWSAVVITAPRDTQETFFDVVSQTVADDTKSAEFELVANLSTEVQVNALSDVAVIFSAALDGPAVIIATVVKDGVPLNEQETVIYHPSISTDEKTDKKLVDDAGGRSYTFAIKDLPPRDTPYRIGVAVRVVKAGILTEASATVYNGILTVLRKTRVGPDLAVGANMGSASKKHESLIEPIHGTRKVVAIIFDPDRTDAPEPDRYFRDGIERVLFGAAPSAADYYRIVSARRFGLEEVAVLGPYKGDKAGGSTSENHYWDGAAHDPNGDEDCSDSTDKYCSPFLEQQAEAMLKASADFDFSQYDLDRDGEIKPSELGILVVTPQNSSSGSHTDVHFSPYVNGDPFTVNGVVIRSLIHWYSPGVGDGTNALVGLESSMTASHEMAHLFLNLDDTYGPYKGIFDGANVEPCPEKGDPACQTRFMSTALHPLSLMTYKTIDSSPHLDGFHKLQLGWVTPRIIAQPGDFNLPGFTELIWEVFILPRHGTDGREYFLLETRFTSDLFNNEDYDYSIGDDGLAVYHVIEPGLACQAQDGAQAPGCVPLIKPTCLTSDLLWDSYFSNFVRPGLRLIQPDMTHERINGFTNFGETLFGTNTGTDLLDEAPGGAVCPTNIGDPLPVGGVPLLLWADGSASGYRLKTIKLDYVGKSVSFTTEITGQ